MVNYCEKLNNLDLSNFDIKNVKYTTSMFRNCNKLNENNIKSKKK